MPAVTPRPASTGLLPARRALTRANESPQVDPRTHDPNPNAPLGSVGPNIEPGFGDTHVMYPVGGMHAEAWQGWPVTWSTPYYGNEYSGFGFGRMNPDGYMSRVSTVMTCVDLNSRQLASFPVYGIASDRPERLPSWAGSPEPELYAGWSEFVKAAVNTYQLRGETLLYATGRFSDGYPSRFVVLNPDNVTIEADAGRLVYTIGQTEIDPRDICHIKFQAMPGELRGIGPLQWLGRNLISASALERYATDIATHGVWALLKHPANLNTKQADALKAGWMSARAASGSAPAVLSGGVEFEALSISPKDMALLDIRTYDEQRIAAGFGVPPFLAGLDQPGGMTYSNSTALYDHHWRATLRPMAQSFSDAMSRWLLPAGHRIEFNRDEYVRPAFGERVAAYATLAAVEQGGDFAMTVDEIRTAERLTPYGPTVALGPLAATTADISARVPL